MRPFLLALAALLVAAPAAQAATIYRDAEAGLTVRVATYGGTVTLIADHACAPVEVIGAVRRSRFTKTATITCGTPPGGGDRVRITGRVFRSRVTGTIDGEPYVALRNGRRATAAERCAGRGMPQVETDTVRVYTWGPRTIACLVADGRQQVLGFEEPGSDELYTTGVAASRAAAAGTRVAYVRDPFDSAADKYAQGDHPSLQPTVTVVDLATGATVASTPPGTSNVQALVLHADGRAAWAGPGPAGTVVMTAAGPLAQGPFAPSTLRVEGSGFAWG